MKLTGERDDIQRASTDLLRNVKFLDRVRTNELLEKISKL